MHVLLLPVGADTWCLPVGCVLEVLGAPVTRAVPGARPGALGVLNLRGDVVPLFDTAALLDLGPSEVAHAVVVSHAGTRAALSTTATPRTAVLHGPGTEASHPAAVAEHEHEDAVVVLLDLERLWQR